MLVHQRVSLLHCQFLAPWQLRAEAVASPRRWSSGDQLCCSCQMLKKAANYFCILLYHYYDFFILFLFLLSFQAFPSLLGLRQEATQVLSLPIPEPISQGVPAIDALDSAAGAKGKAFAARPRSSKRPCLPPVASESGPCLQSFRGKIIYILQYIYIYTYTMGKKNYSMTNIFGDYGPGLA